MEPIASPKNAPTKTAVVAIGGNALLRDDLQPDIIHQWETVRTLAGYITDMVEDGWTIVVTHGNGPQVGYNLRRNELASPEVYPLSFDLLVAHTQGAIGFSLQQTLQNEFLRRNIHRPCVSIVTQVLVDANDPAFANPTADWWLSQPTASTAWNRMAGRWSSMPGVAGDGDCFAEPLAIVEEDAIRQAVGLGWVVICGGGGGVPVVHNSSGELRSVNAVIDKDRASALLASQINADLLLISTGVEKVAINFGKPDQRWIDSMTVEEATRYTAEGQFPPGSMGPKMEACLRFVQASANPNAVALITNPPNLARGLRRDNRHR